jgi:hypothetical protein
MTDENKLKTTGGGTEKTSGQKPLTRKQKRDLSKKRAAERAARGESAPQKHPPAQKNPAQKKPASAKGTSNQTAPKRELTEEERASRRIENKKRHKKRVAERRKRRRERLANAEFKKVETRDEKISRLQKLVKSGKATPGQKGYLRNLKAGNPDLGGVKVSQDDTKFDVTKQRLLRSVESIEEALVHNKSLNGFWHGYPQSTHDRLDSRRESILDDIAALTAENYESKEYSIDRDIDDLISDLNDASSRAQAKAKTDRFNATGSSSSGYDAWNRMRNTNYSNAGDSNNSNEEDFAVAIFGVVIFLLAVWWVFFGR